MHAVPTAMLLAATLLGSAPPPAPDDAVALQTVKYADYLRVIHDLRGKVVVVNFWGEF